MNFYRRPVNSDLARIFGPDGQLAAAHPNFRSRTQQVEMAEAIAEAIADNAQLIAGEQRRNQIGEGFAGAGARFGDELGVVGNSLGNGLRHLDLLRSRAEIGVGGG